VSRCLSMGWVGLEEGESMAELMEDLMVESRAVSRVEGVTEVL
jgi:hypothetical protein